eukprot:8009414-Prorocentrum_lima.AAC.1
MGHSDPTSIDYDSGGHKPKRSRNQRRKEATKNTNENRTSITTWHVYGGTRPDNLRTNTTTAGTDSQSMTPTSPLPTPSKPTPPKAWPRTN